ncbi:MAG: superoxide dismutase [Verrucomicrobiales bacterium]
MITRRALIGTGLAAGAASLLPVATRGADPPPAGPFKLPPLPYAPDALEPHIDAQTMSIHHDKHHASYVAKLNEAVGKTDQKFKGTHEELRTLLSNLDNVPEEVRAAVRNQGGGHYNHSLFWENLSAKGGEPKGELLKSIESTFGTKDELLTKLQDAGAKFFGSGWVWLVFQPSEKKVAIATTPNQDTPLAGNLTPLLAIDVWEHAYYLKYQNRRPDYLKAISNVINWAVVASRYGEAARA